MRTFLSVSRILRATVILIHSPSLYPENNIITRSVFYCFLILPSKYIVSTGMNRLLYHAIYFQGFPHSYVIVTDCYLYHFLPSSLFSSFPYSLHNRLNHFLSYASIPAYFNQIVILSNVLFILIWPVKSLYI